MKTEAVGKLQDLYTRGIEPDLQPITGEVLTGATSNAQNGARLDIAANGFWGGQFERTYFDVRVFNPHAPSHRQSGLPACYRKQEYTSP